MIATQTSKPMPWDGIFDDSLYTKHRSSSRVVGYVTLDDALCPHCGKPLKERSAEDKSDE